MRKHLKGKPSPTGRYTCEIHFKHMDAPAHLGGQSFKSAVRVGKGFNAHKWHVVAYESLPSYHPFCDPESAYHHPDFADLERE